MAGAGSVQHQRFMPIDEPTSVPALSTNMRPPVDGGAGASLVMRPSDAQFTAGHAGKPVPARAFIRARPQGCGCHDRVDEHRLERERRSNRPHDGIQVGCASAVATVLRSNNKATDTHVRDLAPDLFIMAALACDDGAASLEAVAVAQQSLDGVLKSLLFVGEIELHGHPTMLLARMSRWISLLPP